jgi:hypothetical protein
LLEYGSDIEQYFCLFFSDGLLFLLVVEEINRFRDFEDISLADVTNNPDFLCQNDYLFAIKVEDAKEAAEEMRLKLFILLFLEVLVLADSLAFTVDFENGGDANTGEVWHDNETILPHPDSNSL